MSSEEFMFFMLHQYEEMEDRLFGKILKVADSADTVSSNDFTTYCKNRGICK